MEIIPVRGRRDLLRFLRFPRGLYPPSSLWVSPLDWERVRFFDPKRNPFFDHAAIECFLALDATGRPVGRIAAIDNPNFERAQGRKLGFFGFFDSVEDSEVSAALFDVAEAWLKERGLSALQGPVSPSTNHECGLLVKGFDRPPRILMPYNHPYYERLVEGAGYHGVQDLVAYEYDVDGRVPERLGRAVEMLKKRHSFTIRPIDFKKFDEELERIKRVYNEGWAENYGFVPLTDAEIEWLARELKPITGSDLCAFAEVDGEVVGIMINLPDLNQALRAARGRLFPFGWWKILRRLKRIDGMRAMVMGIRPGYRKIGIDYGFYHAGLMAAHGRRYREIELSWVLENNVELLRALGRLEARETKRYRLYEKQLA